MSEIMKVLAGLMMLGGSAFIVVAAVGILRLPDLYTRMHAASKAGVVGTGMLLLALAMTTPHLGEALRALAAILFFTLTTPLAAHLLAKAARAAGTPLWSGTVLDEMPAEMRESRGSLQSERSVGDASAPAEQALRNEDG